MGFLKRPFGGAPAAETAPERPEPEREDLRSAPPAGGVLLPRGPGREVVGEWSYQANIRKATGGAKRAGVRVVITAALVREPRNRYDRNAVAVMLAGLRCGYLPRNLASVYAPVLDRLVVRGETGYCRADVRGGWRFDDGSWADFGITVYVDAPASLDEWLDKRGA